MSVTLQITVSFHPSLNKYLNKYIKICDVIASQNNIKEGYEVAVLYETSETLKINYRGKAIDLPWSKIRIVTLEKNDLSYFTGAPQ